jgi:hypothetical protein
MEDFEEVVVDVAVVVDYETDAVVVASVAKIKSTIHNLLQWILKEKKKKTVEMKIFSSLITLSSIIMMII